MKIRDSVGLTDRDNKESQNCDEAISSNNQMYADALLSRQHQDEESNSLEQRVDALFKKRDLMNKSCMVDYTSRASR